MRRENQALETPRSKRVGEQNQSRSRCCSQSQCSSACFVLKLQTSVAISAQKQQRNFRRASSTPAEAFKKIGRWKPRDRSVLKSRIRAAHDAAHRVSAGQRVLCSNCIVPVLLPRLPRLPRRMLVWQRRSDARARVARARARATCPSRAHAA